MASAVALSLVVAFAGLHAAHAIHAAANSVAATIDELRTSPT